ncbi:MAG TPA: nucleotide exchange factor GrpE [Caldisericia bacterium]|nr:nucleotide exchange factor GrpE [Caldisericia bacterium]HPF48960.1 nucleotide exchange factor GrpE [Caldisericia bacterium]HPI83176.1 nucleotide exchange factor GrpE [Caldisericia bacterium]HPQ92403.1 nucleotide exchange factor GrpE [Caldisericia bacterium]HRV74499.1 nucleotide exchange factor GrpE [Caldisericia bacterium]
MKNKKEEQKNIVAGLTKIASDWSVIKDRLSELEAENKQLRSNLFNSMSDNKRLMTISQREKEQESTATLRKVSNELIPVMDDLDRAKEMLSSSSGDEASVKAIEFILMSLEKAFIRIGIEPFAPIGFDFDPHTCELGGKEPSDVHEEDKICRVLRKGYRLGENIIRPAMVVCSSGKKTNDKAIES